jgi:ribA/ribD-fused uncharacterized protein
MEKRRMEKITSFTGKYFFLSNFFPITVTYEGIQYPSSEHAYVAAKTLDIEVRKLIPEIPTAGKVKRFGREIQLRSDWESVKINEMRRILERKFSVYRSDMPMFAMLKATAPNELIEGNTWGDTFWGQCPVGSGKNMLGKLLMEIRDDISTNFGE